MEEAAVDGVNNVLTEHGGKKTKSVGCAPPPPPRPPTSSHPFHCLLSDCEAEWETRWCINMQTALSRGGEDGEEEGKGRRIWCCQLKCSGPWWPCGKPVHLPISTVMSLHWLIARARTCVRVLPTYVGSYLGIWGTWPFVCGAKFYF